uniref:NADH-ubiquinone oxidoreductase chain 6 n=1 Tax=Emeia pseudosauteri TaxID=2592744 RepID=A0A5C0PWY2_9COLE|nr:NADH dehydrogenase subunit 6 [Emeia pseudosauteri]QEJ81588.1 NADH dehydrogenase subunit 6 [Emeia pseudosauteri]
MEMMLSLMISFSLLLTLINHPLAMGLTLLIITTLICMLTGFLNLNFWFSYILFIVMIGGLLVLFIYMTSIASNEKFKFNNFITIFFLIIPITLLTIILTNDSFNLQNSFNNIDSLKLNIKPFFFSSLMKFMSYPMSMISIMLMTYLLITLIAVVKITTIKYGPLRQKF